MFPTRQLINLTPHPVTLISREGVSVTLQSAGVARLTRKPSLDGVRFFEQVTMPVCPAPVYESVEGLPPPSEDKAYIVSLIALNECRGRRDVFAPATGPDDGAVRDEKGRIVAVTKLVSAPL